MSISHLLSLPNEIFYNIICFLEDDINSTFKFACTSKKIFNLIKCYSSPYILLHSCFCLRDKKWKVLKQEKEELVYECDENTLKFSQGYSSQIMSVDEQGRRYEQLPLPDLRTFYSSYYTTPLTFYIFNPQSLTRKISHIADAAMIVLNQNLLHYDKMDRCHLLEQGVGFVLTGRSGYVVYKWCDQHVETLERVDLSISYSRAQILFDSVYINRKLFLKMCDGQSHKYFSTQPLIQESKLQEVIVENSLITQMKSRSSRVLREWSLTVLSNQLYLSYVENKRLHFLPVVECENKIALYQKLLPFSIDQITTNPIAFGKWTLYVENHLLCVFNSTTLWITSTDIYSPAPQDISFPHITYFVSANCLFLVYKHLFRVIYLPTKQEITDSFSELKTYLDEHSTLYSLSLNFDIPNTKMHVSTVIKSAVPSSQSGIYLYKFVVDLSQNFELS